MENYNPLTLRQAINVLRYVSNLELRRNPIRIEPKDLPRTRCIRCLAY